MQAVLPVAGEGSRLRPLTDDRPKALLEVAGRPILDRLLEVLSPPVRQVCLVVHPEEADAFRRRYGNTWEGIRISYATQGRRRGVADAVVQARPFLSGRFVVVMGDVFFSEPLALELEAWRDSDARGAVLVERVSDPPEDAIGLAWLERGRVMRVEKRPWRGQTPYRVAGTFGFSPSVFDVIDELDPAATGELELEGAVNELIRRGERFAALEYRGWRRNINTIADLRLVERRLAPGPARGSP